MRRITRQCVAACAVTVLAAWAPISAAQSFPSKPLRLVLPFPPGGPTDLLGRAVAQKLGEQMGQQVIADNRPGAGGNLGLEVTAKSPPDGYTMVLSSPLISLSPLMYSKLNFDPTKDLAPVSLVATIQNLLIVHPSVPARTLREFIQIARGAPGKLNYGSGGVGTTSHLAPELMKSLTRTQIVHVPFKGTGQALLGLIGGQIDALIMAVPASYGQVQAGKVRALAVLDARRASVLPDVPTAKEAGVDNLDVPIWYGLLVATGTPRELVARLHGEVVKALGAADLRERFATAGIQPNHNTPEQFAAFIVSERTRYAKVIRDAGIKAE